MRRVLILCYAECCAMTREAHAMPYIHHQLNGASICHYELGECLTIGRSTDNQLVIDDATVSSRHAVIEKTDDGYQIRSEEHTSELQSRGHLVCRLLLEKK